VDEHSVDERGVSFVVTNDSDIPGATVAQLYVAGPAEPAGGVLRPARELKGFRKIRLGAHESKVVHIAFDRYTFRHYDAAAGAWRTQSGQWTLMVGTNAEDLPLAAPVTVPFIINDDEQTAPAAPVDTGSGNAGLHDAALADRALGHYLTGDVKHATDAEVAALFGHEMIPSGAPSVFGVNDPISSWKDSKGFAARTIARTLIKREAKIREKTGAPDLNVLFILNMPPRAMSKMTQGMVDSAMVDAVVRIANGHTLRGAGAFIAGFFRNRRANNRLAKELRS
jgi:beta-glucosidase